jgi:hypothetical protein
MHGPSTITGVLRGRVVHFYLFHDKRIAQEGLYQSANWPTDFSLYLSHSHTVTVTQFSFNISANCNQHKGGEEFAAAIVEK